MSASTIAIRNVHVMMAYAFQAIRQGAVNEVSTEPFDHLHDLVAEILARGVSAQIKRGLHRDYRPEREELATIRGRISITETIARRSLAQGRLVCEFDEYVSDTPHNRALKSVIVLLIRHGEVQEHRRNRLRRLLDYLREVRLLSPDEIDWSALTYHRSNAEYRLLIGTCELVVRGLIPTNESGDGALATWFSDDQMSSLYERFLREYFRFHHPELSAAASHVTWDVDPMASSGLEQLPAMRTDVTLRRDGRTLIIDAKFYSTSMQKSPRGKRTIHSGHLYQVLSYTKNADVLRDGSVSGLLLYAQTSAVQQPALDAVIQGNRIGARTLDLSRPWSEIQAELESILTWLD